MGKQPKKSHKTTFSESERKTTTSKIIYTPNGMYRVSTAHIHTVYKLGGCAMCAD
jgi:hypothetical protein